MSVTGTFAFVAGLNAAFAPSPDGGVALFQLAESAHAPPAETLVHTGPPSAAFAALANVTTTAFMPSRSPPAIVSCRAVIVNRLCGATLKRERSTSAFEALYTSAV